MVGQQTCGRLCSFHAQQKWGVAVVFKTAYLVRGGTAFLWLLSRLDSHALHGGDPPNLPKLLGGIRTNLLFLGGEETPLFQGGLEK